MSKISKSWLKMAEIYKIFADGWNNIDFSDKAKQEMFDFESSGRGDIEIDCFSTTNNGFAVGKKWLNVQVAMWIEDIQNGIIGKVELYNDKKFPHWWLDKVLKGIHPKDGLPGIWGYYKEIK
jgi:hypothetical protein